MSRIAAHKILLVALFTSVFIWNPLRGNSPSEGVANKQNSKGASEKSTAHPDATQPGTKASPFVVDVGGHIPTAKEATEAEKEANRSRDIERRTLSATERSADAAFWGAIATWFLVGVGGLAAYLANKTLTAIKDQVDLMAVPYRQSVVFKNWEFEVYAAYPENTPAISIGFSLSGAIDFPVTIHYGEIIFMPQTSPTPYFIQETFLPPDTPHFGNVCFAITDHTKQVMKYGPMAFSFEGHFVHTGPLGHTDRTKQDFSGDLICRDGEKPVCEFRLHSNQKHNGGNTASYRFSK